jgi:purine nucleosidase
MPEPPPIPLLLDTDIGDNVDDALAVALAGRSPELNLRGVTTVFRDTAQRAAVALAVLDAFDRGDVPVAAGVGKPLIGPWDHRAPDLFAPDLTRYMDRTDRRGAVRFLVEIIDALPAPITLCAIGPLTNVAIVLAMRPDLADKLRLVVMGGTITSRERETNMAADPEAARIVLASRAEITLVGLDVTRRCTLSAAEVDRIRASGAAGTRLLARMIEAWSGRHARLPTPHDPLAVALAFMPDLCRREPMAVTVDTSNEAPRGVTLAAPLASSRTQVCTDVDRDRFVACLLDRIGAAP